jgi:hypothetical protein
MSQCYILTGGCENDKAIYMLKPLFSFGVAH